MTKKKSHEEIVNEYEKKSQAILHQMMQVLLRAQRQVDDTSYKKALDSVEDLK